MKTPYLILLIVVQSLSNVVGQNFKFGLERSSIDYTRVKQKKYAGGSTLMPAAFSLEKYSPAAGDQQSLGSCTSWATAYCALTIVKNIESAGRGAGPFDPHSLHSRLKALRNEDPCSDGNYIEAAASLLKSHGCPALTDQSCGYEQASMVYDYRLSDFNYLAVDAEVIKSALFQDKSPVVIAANVYFNGWHEYSNLEEGIWNGYREEPFSRHAMVIIGYDDYKAGGSFLIQNSWGPYWGNNGRFWMKYADIQDVIYLAVQFLPGNKTGKIGNGNNSNIYRNSVFNDKIKLQDNRMHEKQKLVIENQNYRFYNDCHLTVYVSFAQNKNGILLTEGWYPVTTGSYTDIDISQRDKDEVFWMATAQDSEFQVDWTDERNGKVLCMDRFQSHSITNSFADCASSARFIKSAPGFKDGITASRLTCPGNQSYSNQYSPQRIEFDVDSEDPMKSSWNGDSALLDYYSARPIIPEYNSAGQLLFEVYYVKDNKIMQFRGTKNQLIDLKYPKFSNSRNAQDWLKITR